MVIFALKKKKSKGFNINDTKNTRNMYTETDLYSRRVHRVSAQNNVNRGN